MTPEKFVKKAHEVTNSIFGIPTAFRDEVENIVAYRQSPDINMEYLIGTKANFNITDIALNLNMNFV